MIGRTCRDGDHRPPASGGACACGMVTRILARPAESEATLRDLVVRFIGDGAADPAQVADRLVAALSAAGLSVSPGGARLPV
jgi:hypothetical protein